MGGCALRFDFEFKMVRSLTMMMEPMDWPPERICVLYFYFPAEVKVSRSPRPS